MRKEKKENSAPNAAVIHTHPTHGHETCKLKKWEREKKKLTNMTSLPLNLNEKTSPQSFP